MIVSVLVWGVGSIAKPAAADETYSSDEILEIAKAFFGGTAEGLATIVEKAVSDFGRPNGYIAGEELSGAYFDAQTVAGAGEVCVRRRLW